MRNITGAANGYLDHSIDLQIFTDGIIFLGARILQNTH